MADDSYAIVKQGILNAIKNGQGSVQLRSLLNADILNSFLQYTKANPYSFKNINDFKRCLDDCKTITTLIGMVEQLLHQHSKYLTNLQTEYEKILNKDSIFATTNLSYKQAIRQRVLSLLDQQNLKLEQIKTLIRKIYLLGYQLTMQIREGITGEDITYRVGLNDLNGQQLYEQTITDEQLFNAVTLQSNKGQFVLRVSNAKSLFTNLQKAIKGADDLEKEAKELAKTISKKDNIINMSEIAAYVEARSTMWSTVFAYGSARNSLPHGKPITLDWGFTQMEDVQIKTVNRGFLYEIYQDVISQTGTNEKYLGASLSPAAYTLQTQYFINKLGTAQYLQGGDKGLQQLKLFTRTAKGSFINPQLVTTQTIAKEISYIQINLQRIVNGDHVNQAIQELVARFYQPEEKMKYDKAQEALTIAAQKVI